MSRIILPPALDFVSILIKSPLQLKLMTGAHPVTVAPLVFLHVNMQDKYVNMQAIYVNKQLIYGNMQGKN